MYDSQFACLFLFGRIIRGSLSATPLRCALRRCLNCCSGSAYGEGGVIALTSSLTVACFFARGVSESSCSESDDSILVLCRFVSQNGGQKTVSDNDTFLFIFSFSDEPETDACAWLDCLSLSFFSRLAAYEEIGRSSPFQKKDSHLSLSLSLLFLLLFLHLFLYFTFVFSSESCRFSLWYRWVRKEKRWNGQNGPIQSCGASNSVPMV